VKRNQYGPAPLTASFVQPGLKKHSDCTL